jgi:CheY-like chemotaxis protein
LPDCVLLDYKLPDMTGAEFLLRLGDQNALSDPEVHSAAVPEGDLRPDLLTKIDLPKFAVVMLTGLGNEQVAAEAIRAGAQDYLAKDGITSKSLRLAIEKATGKVRLLKDLQAERDRLARLLSEKEALLTEKDALLKEVHHRVKNNLQVIASLLRLQAENFGDAKLAAALQESQNRVESMALIHEQLYQARNLREVDLAENAALLANHLMHAYGAYRMPCERGETSGRRGSGHTRGAHPERVDFERAEARISGGARRENRSAGPAEQRIRRVGGPRQRHRRGARGGLGTIAYVGAEYRSNFDAPVAGHVCHRT